MALNFNLRNVKPEVMAFLKKKAADKKISINSLILQMIEKELGFTQPIKKKLFHDLDYLAGTWSAKDKEIFNINIHSFEKIDEEFWI